MGQSKVDFWTRAEKVPQFDAALMTLGFLNLKGSKVNRNAFFRAMAINTIVDAATARQPVRKVQVGKTAYLADGQTPRQMDKICHFSMHDQGKHIEPEPKEKRIPIWADDETLRMLDEAIKTLGYPDRHAWWRNMMAQAIAEAGKI